MTYKDYKPKYAIEHVRQQCEKLAKQSLKGIQSPWIIRHFRALKWKYESNDSFRLLVDSVLMFCSLGLLIAFVCFIHYLLNT